MKASPLDLSGNWTPVAEPSSEGSVRRHHPIWGDAPLTSGEVSDLVDRVVKSTDEDNILDHLDFITNKPKWVRYTPAVNKAFQTLMAIGKESRFFISKALEYAEEKTRTKYEDLRQLERALSDKKREITCFGSSLKQTVRDLALRSFEDHSSSIREYQAEYDQASTQHNEAVEGFNVLWKSFNDAYVSYEYQGDRFTLKPRWILEQDYFVLPVNSINLASVAEASRRDDASYREDQAYLQSKRDR